jgi:regulation of enolase protein 1 (concanavalin A-like superfamily)
MAGESILFRDEFKGALAPGWSFVRENTNGWRVLDGALQIRIEPGNMWGGENSGKNVMVRQAPDPGTREIEVTVTVSNQPTAQYEQVDLVWYYNDSNMVKLGLELVDGKLSIVMGREENDRTRTIALISVSSHQMQLRHRVNGNAIRGQYRPLGTEEWLDAGKCDLPARGAPKLALQCYQGPKNAEHWATIKDFTVRAIDP